MALPLATRLQQIAKSALDIQPGQDASATSGIPNFAREANIANQLSGLGGNLDKGNVTRFSDSWLNHYELEIIYRQSWAAQVMINAPVKDMWMRGRKITGDDEEAVKKFQETERKLKAHKRLAAAQIAGRLFGGALLVIFPKGNASMLEPMDIEKIPEDGIANLWVIDKDSCSIHTWETDPRKEGFGLPNTYLIAPRVGANPQFEIHHSWAIRFDGLQSPLTDGWWFSPFDRHWGISLLTKAVNELERHEAMHAGIGHLVQEASIFTMKIQGFKEALMGQNDEDEPSIGVLGQSINILKSIYRVLFLDAEDEADRVAVNFSGIPDLIDRQIALLAAIADIPATRFYGQAPKGMNATGESDAQNYQMQVMALQQEMSDDVLDPIIDPLIAKVAGLPEPPEYEWLPIVDVSELDQAEAMKAYTEGVMLAINGPRPVIDENEARERLSKWELWGELGEFPGLELTPEEELAAEQEEARMKMEGESKQAELKIKEKQANRPAAPPSR